MNWHFISDEHYGHRNIIDFCKRPFTDIYHMRETLIKNHNEVVKPEDAVIHIGDMYWNNLTEQECLEIRMRLNGTHYYIMGNHEKQMTRSSTLRSTFVWVQDVMNLQIPGYAPIWLSHYAHRVWPASHKGSYHLFGHSHAELQPDGSLSLDVGVDNQNFYPISLEDVDKKMKEISNKFTGKSFICPNKKCGNKFYPVHSRPTKCSKCGSEMELR
jgi:calcineurin-like phosphoesterase family protein